MDTSIAELDVRLDGRGAWPDLLRPDIQVGHWRRLAAMPARDTGTDPQGLQVGVLIEQLDGRPLFATVAWALLYAAVQAIAAAYGVPEAQP